MTKEKKKDNIMDLIKSPYMRSFLRKYWLSYLLGIFFLIAIDFAQTRIPVYIGSVIDSLDAASLSTAELTHDVVAIALIAVGIVLGRIIWRYFIFGTARKIERDIRNDLFSHLEGLSLNYYQQHKTGEIMAYITNDLEAVRQAMGQGIMMVCDVICLLIFILSSMLSLVSVSLTIYSVLPLAVIAVVTGLLGPRLFKKFFARQKAFAEISDFVQEDISGIKVIKAFVQQEKEIDSFDKINQNYFSKNMSLTKTRAMMDPIMTLIAGLAFVVAVIYGGYLALNTQISVGDFTVFIQYLGMLVWPMIAVGMSINMITMGSASLKRIEDVLEAKFDITDEPTASEVENFCGSIKVDNLTFSYPEKDMPALKNISFEIQEGQTLGIVGKTGSGKTTLTNLLVRIYDCEKGSIFVSGKDIREMPLKQLRSNIGYVTQDNFLFSDTIKNNIDFVNENASMDKITEAAEFSCVNDNIVEFPDGYETIIGEKGVTLSGGQKQRVSISRAYIIEPKILIMDDSLSAVDTDTEERILKNLKEKRNGKTNIIIAHRLSALQHADKIIVIDNGEIIEHGNHKTLLQQKGLYYSLYKKQQLEKMINEEE
ncbi:MAG TPA: ABC transporter ATP-binding protein [Clostridia bacterium]|nr:ABC transporter ATP-binding protein [Clostridia bacterium]